MFSKRFRLVSFNVHKWVGLHLSLFFGLVFLTGAILVFKPELDALRYPAALSKPVAPARLASFGATWTSVKERMPAAQILWIDRQPAGFLATRTAVVDGAGNRRDVWTDPVDATVLATTNAKEFMKVFLELHEQLLIPNRAVRLAVTAMSVVLLGMVISGMLTYRRFWKGLFRFPRRSLERRAYWSGVHRFVAVWSIPFLLIAALTGVLYFIDIAGFRGVKPTPPVASVRAQAYPDGLDAATVDAAAQAAVAAYPGFFPNRLATPNKPTVGLGFSGQHETPRWLGTSTVYVDPVNLQVLGIVEPSDYKGVARLIPPADALHRGRWGGTATRVLWVIFGLASTYLVYAGTRIYLARMMPPDANGGALSAFVAGLGIFKWAYLLGAVGVIAITAYRFLA